MEEIENQYGEWEHLITLQSLVDRGYLIKKGIYINVQPKAGWL